MYKKNLKIKYNKNDQWSHIVNLFMNLAFCSLCTIQNYFQIINTNPLLFVVCIYDGNYLLYLIFSKFIMR